MRNEDKKTSIQFGEVVQVNQNSKLKPLQGCFATVVEPLNWGIKGYVSVPGAVGESPERVAVDLQWKDIEYVGPAPFASKRFA